MNEIKYKISEFAVLLGVTPKTLRFYEKIGLLFPDSIDEKTKYRFYSSWQLQEAASIIQLKKIGFSLSEIKKFNLKQMSFDKKKILLLKQRETIDTMLNGLDYIKNTASIYSVVIKSEVKTAVTERQVFATHFRDLIPQFYDFAENYAVTHFRLSTPQYFVTEFLDGEFQNDNVSALFKIGIVPKKNSSYGFVPATQYITTLHKGGYDSIALAYTFLQNYMKFYGISAIGNPSERYYENYDSQNEETAYLTEVRYPIK